MGILSGNPKHEPMHYGEVMGVWSYLASAKGFLVGYQTLSNHTGDEDLRKYIKDTIDHIIKPEIEETEKILKANGIGLPPTPPERPVATVETIPPGARILDPEIATMVAKDHAAGLVTCSTIMGQSIREDIGALFGQFHLKRAQYGLTLLRLMKEKGWIVPPPLHVMTPEEKA